MIVVTSFENATKRTNMFNSSWVCRRSSDTQFKKCNWKSSIQIRGMPGIIRDPCKGAAPVTVVVV